MTAEEMARVYGALRSELANLSVQNIRNAAAAAGIDVSRIPSTSEARTGMGSRSEVLPVVDRLFGDMSDPAKETALRVLAQRLSQGERGAELAALLAQHGYAFAESVFVPVGLIDQREAAFLPSSSASELARAMTS